MAARGFGWGEGGRVGNLGFGNRIFFFLIFKGRRLSDLEPGPHIFCVAHT